MRRSTLLARSLRWHWRTNLAVIGGVTIAAGVLGGALLVGGSLRASLRTIALARLGNVAGMLTRGGLVREELALSAPGSAPIIATEGAITSDAGGRAAAAVEIYAVDQRFSSLQARPDGVPSGDEAVLTAALLRELRIKPGDTILVRVRKPSAIPRESLYGRKDDAAKTLRLTVAAGNFEFSLLPHQGDLRAAYLPLGVMQRELGVDGKVNTVLVRDDRDASRMKQACSLADLGLSVRTANAATLVVESDQGVLSDAVAKAVVETARALGLRAQPVLTYLANTIRVECVRGDCPAVPYSVVTAVDSDLAPRAGDGIVINEWLARSLVAKPGDMIGLDYFTWESRGQLSTARARFRVERIVPLTGDAADSSFTPNYPGITASRNLRDWDPPFPIDLARVRPEDEAYWTAHRTTPKAFVRLSRGQELWGTRFGKLSSIRVSPSAREFAPRLRIALDPEALGLSYIPLRSRALTAATGTSDFGEYFLYFSFFLIVSALLLVGLFFRLGVEQRAREIGTLRALGYSSPAIQTLFLAEGAVLAAIGGIAGVGAAVAYGALILYGLRTWWTGAVGTATLSLHVSFPALASGALGGAVAGLAASALTLRSLNDVAPRPLIAGAARSRPAAWQAPAGIAATLGAAAMAGTIGKAPGFFGCGSLLLIGMLLFLSAWLRSAGFASLASQVGLGLRGITCRPGRSVLCTALIASAVFVIVALDAFRAEGSEEGAGGYPFLATSSVPLVHDLNSVVGREAANLGVTGAEFVPFRLKPGDDASCLNLYRPLNARVIAPPASFLREAKFGFAQVIAPSSNPWLLLDQELADGAIPAIADANSITYSLHLNVGDTLTQNGVRYRLVAALRDSIFQGELIISEGNFLRLFPDIEGFRLFLIRSTNSGIAAQLEDELSDYGFSVQNTRAKLAAFHRVENTYLSTFRALGLLGLLLGTLGLAAVLLRNVLERRRELALLRAVGFRAEHVATVVLVENAALLVAGLAIGATSALAAIAPVNGARGSHIPWMSMGVLLGLVLVTGLAASVAATLIAVRAPLLESLRAE